MMLLRQRHEGDQRGDENHDRQGTETHLTALVVDKPTAGDTAATSGTRSMSAGPLAPCHRSTPDASAAIVRAAVAICQAPNQRHDGCAATCARTFTAKEAVQIGLINKCVPQKNLLKETLAWCETIKSHSPQTLRMTKKSLNFESDLLYASWQHGMELLAHVWGSEESLEGMDAFLNKRTPNFKGK